jgi:hypothetical protein
MDSLQVLHHYRPALARVSAEVVSPVKRMRKPVPLSECTLQKCCNFFNRLALILGVPDKRVERLAVYPPHNTDGALTVITEQVFLDSLFPQKQRAEFRFQKLRRFRSLFELPVNTIERRQAVHSLSMSQPRLIKVARMASYEGTIQTLNLSQPTRRASELPHCHAVAGGRIVAKPWKCRRGRIGNGNSAWLLLSPCGTTG